MNKFIKIALIFCATILSTYISFFYGGSLGLFTGVSSLGIILCYE